MNEYTIIGVIIAVVGIFKGKEVWDFLKHVHDNKKKDSEITDLKNKLNEAAEIQAKLIKKNKSLETSNTRLKKLLK